MEDKKRAAYRTGFIVFILLVLLTAAEFWVATQGGSTVPLFLIALVKAALIIRYFMHVNRLWAEEEHE